MAGLRRTRRHGDLAFSVFDLSKEFLALSRPKNRSSMTSRRMDIPPVRTERQVSRRLPMVDSTPFGSPVWFVTASAPFGLEC